MSKDNFLEVYDNAFSVEFCNKAIKYFEAMSKAKRTIETHTHKTLSRTDKGIFLVPWENEECSFNYMCAELSDEFANIFEGIYKDYADKYSIIKTIEKHGSWSIKMQKTKPGQGYHDWHCETTGKVSSNRVLVWTVYLNDISEGGETEFLYQRLRVQPKQGSVLIFPAAFTHTHRGNPPLLEDKYILTGWMEFA